MAPEGTRVPRVAIVGAGLSGISMGIALRSELKFHNFTIYESASGVGGTWRDTTYPGCGSDVPGHWYSLSTELNPNWTTHYVSQPELKAYWERLFYKHRLECNTTFETEVRSAEWDESAQLWRITVRDVTTDEERQAEAEVLIWATGPFPAPAYPRAPGLDKFRGEVWHTSRWRHDVSLAGKRVAVLGNGCSAAQLVPEISADPTVQVFNFARTRQWLWRNFLMARSDLGFIVFNAKNAKSIQRARTLLEGYIKMQAPAELADKLIPDFSPGCRRMIVDPGYLASLHRPNVTLVQENIESFNETGVQPANAAAFVSVDHIILATGYDVMGAPRKITGRGGVELGKWFEEQGGPTAYLGSLAPAFPNLVNLVGPNTATGHASIIFTAEVQIQYALKLLKPILVDRTARSLEVTAEACDEYNRWVQERLQQTVWTQCASFYRAGQSGKIFGTWPGMVTLFWWMNRVVNWDHYIAVEVRKGAIRRKRRQELVRRCGAWAVVGALLVLLSSKARRASLMRTLSALLAVR